MKAELLTKKLKSYKKDDSQIQVYVHTNQNQMMQVTEAAHIEIHKGKKIIALTTDESMVKTYRVSDVETAINTLKSVCLKNAEDEEIEDRELFVGLAEAMDDVTKLIRQQDKKRYKTE